MNTCKNMDGWEYRLWTSEDITKKNFPLTFDLIQNIIRVGTHDNKLTKKLAH